MRNLVRRCHLRVIVGPKVTSPPNPTQTLPPRYRAPRWSLVARSPGLFRRGTGVAHNAGPSPPSASLRGGPPPLLFAPALSPIFSCFPPRRPPLRSGAAPGRARNGGPYIFFESLWSCTLFWNRDSGTHYVFADAVDVILRMFCGGWCGPAPPRQ